ncbi:MAG: tRNA (adenosine(37)-N6)-dimethylallyltransferase MiaA [Planctomycetota bacterium]
MVEYSRKDTEIILLLGCTASGKTSASLELAQRLDAEIVSIDSMQVYRRMDIGTAKPSPEELATVRHHLIDVAEPSELFSVARFVEMADQAIADIRARDRRILALAGTPLYLMGLMHGMFDGPAADEDFRAKLRRRAEHEGTAVLHTELSKVDPDAAARIHPNDYKRIERALEVWRLTGIPLSRQQRQWNAEALRYPTKIVGIRREKEDNSSRINTRVKQMIEAGLVDEVQSLLAEPAGFGEQARQALGYAQIIRHLQDRSPLDDAVEQIKIQSRRLAKHQRTWFRKFTTTRWVDVASDEPVASIADGLMRAISREGGAA